MAQLFHKTCIVFALFVSASVMAAVPEQITLSKLHIEKTDLGLAAIIGNAHNDTTTTLKSVFVKFNLYQEGKIIGETTDSMENIGPGENWVIQAPILVFKGKPDNYKVTEIQVFN